MGTQKNRLNETVLLSTQNTGKKTFIINFYAQKFCLSIYQSSEFLKWSLPVDEFNPLLASSDFCRLLITFANRLDLDQDHDSVGPDLDPNCLSCLIL